jgi:hypothetical protein
MLKSNKNNIISVQKNSFDRNFFLSRFWSVMEDAAYHTGDRVWRMPLWKYYSDQIQSTR